MAWSLPCTIQRARWSVRAPRWLILLAVGKADPLVDIDSRQYRATLLQAQGALERDQNILAQAQMDLERYRPAWARNAIAKQILDDQEKLVLQNQGTVKNDQGTV